MLRTGLTRRPVTEGDQDLLRALFVEARPDLALLPRAVREDLVDLQLRGRDRAWTAAHPQARRDVVALEGRDVGTAMVAEAADVVHLIDLAVLTAHRGRGVATAVVAEEISRSAGRPLRLSVWPTNHAARGLYERLGFRVDGETGGYLTMTHLDDGGPNDG